MIELRNSEIENWLNICWHRGTNKWMKLDGDLGFGVFESGSTKYSLTPFEAKAVIEAYIKKERTVKDVLEEIVELVDFDYYKVDNATSIDLDFRKQQIRMLAAEGLSLLEKEKGR